MNGLYELIQLSLDPSTPPLAFQLLQHCIHPFSVTLQLVPALHALNVTLRLCSYYIQCMSDSCLQCFPYKVQYDHINFYTRTN